MRSTPLSSGCARTAPSTTGAWRWRRRAWKAPSATAGRSRVIQKLRTLGIDADVAEAAVSEVFEEVDEGALLDRAFERRLRGQEPKDLDERGRARIVRGLAAQGFRFEAIMKRLKGGPDR